MIRKRLIRVAGVVALFTLLFHGAGFSAAQSEPRQAQVQISARSPEYAFDVVSIRPSQNTNFVVGVQPDGYQARGLSLGATIVTAFLPPALGSRDVLVNAPSWVWDEPFDFEAKVAQEDLKAWQASLEHSNSMVPNAMLQAMLRNALVDRCKMQFHVVPSERMGFALVVGKRGINPKAVRPSPPDVSLPGDAIKFEGGAFLPIMSEEKPYMAYFRTSMLSLTHEMSRLLGTPIEDRTDLRGAYDFHLTRLALDPDPGSAWDWSALGLKLIHVHVASEKIVLDHIERPSPN